MRAPSLTRRAASLVVAGSAALAGCDRVAKSTAEGALATRVERAVPEIERATGLQFKQRPRVELRTPAEVRAFLEKGFAESRAARELAGQEAAYKMFGLVPDSLDLRKLLLDLLEQQVAGFYDPKTKALYVVKGTASDALGITVAHELVHALQDQYVSLDSIQNARVDNDQATAAQAAIEGHATYISTLNAVGDERVRELPGGWAGIAAQIRASSGGAPGLDKAPPALREALIFPYADGLAFAARAYAGRPGVELITRGPPSTEQVLHAAAAQGGAGSAPTRLTLPPLRGARSVYENTLGEFETRLVLAEHLADTARAARAAAGWGGDRYAILETPSGRGLVWISVWDSATDAAEFFAAMQAAELRRRGRSGPGRWRVTRQVAVSGRPAVLFMDLPGELPNEVVDVAAVSAR